MSWVQWIEYKKTKILSKLDYDRIVVGENEPGWRQIELQSTVASINCADCRKCIESNEFLSNEIAMDVWYMMAFIHEM